MSVKYDWHKLKKEWLGGEWLTLKEFAEDKKIDYQQLRNHGRNWARDKKQLNDMAITKIEEKIVDDEVDAFIDYNNMMKREGKDVVLDQLKLIKDTKKENGKFESNAAYKGNNASQTIERIDKIVRLSYDKPQSYQKGESNVEVNVKVSVEDLKSLLGDSIIES